MRHVLVVGGAGYIGSFFCKYLSLRGYRPIVLDNLVNGHRQAVKWGPFIYGSMDDSLLLKRILSEYRVEAVLHFAAFCYVGESVGEPCKYYDNNVASTIKLLQMIIENGIKNFIFSSTAATYGVPQKIPIDECHPQNPINPYGRSKLMVELILEDFKKAYGLNYVALRYFNAAGADSDNEIGEDHNPETHLVPLILRSALGCGEEIKIYGNDYPTKDGTCVRDYIHIADLAQAHFLAMERLLNGQEGGIYNLGNGIGFSVNEIVGACRRVTGKHIKTVFSERRSGDPPVLISNSEKATNELGWKPEFSDLYDIIETSWKWHKTHPNGII